MKDVKLKQVDEEEIILEEQEEDEEEPYVRYEITTFPSDFTLEVLDSRYKAGEIEIPTFQCRRTARRRW